MDVVLARTVSLLVVAMLVAIVARRVRLPYTVGLVIAGGIFALLRVESGMALTQALIYLVILPPLLFEAALKLRWPDLRRDLAPVLTLTIGGVLIAAAVVAAGMVFGAGWPLRSALVFGVLIAATDPVAVIAMFKDNGVGGRIRLLVESESLFNDGVAAVLFGLAVLFAQGYAFSPAQMGWAVLYTAVGGVLIGLLCGGVAALVAGRSKDRLVETALSVAAAYGSFLAAEHAHTSGVLATVAAGLLMGNFATADSGLRRWLSPQSRKFLIEFWDFAAFLANSLVFLLIGFAVGGLPLTLSDAITDLLAILVVVLGRLLSVYPIGLLFWRSRRRVSLREQTVLWWGGLRGALALALVLSVPPSLPLRDEMVLAAFAVAAFSIVVQGLSMPLLLRALRFLS
jgi:CPA1 family monovalent cation:H+ antiporter